MDRHPSRLISAQLGPEERILWIGTPGRGRGVRFRSTDWFTIPFSIIWCGFAIFWEFMALTKIPKVGSTVLFPLWGIPFVLVGLYLFIGRFFHDAKIINNLLRKRAAIFSCRLLIGVGRFSERLVVSTPILLRKISPLIRGAVQKLSAGPERLLGI